MASREMEVEKEVQLAKQETERQTSIVSSIATGAMKMRRNPTAGRD
jgi:hypothetical protein